MFYYANLSFILAVFWNFWRITCLSTTNHRWVINAQTGPVLLAHPVFPKIKILNTCYIQY